MSAILLRAPRGRDEGLDLSPPSFSLNRQAAFLHAFCRENPQQSYADGVVELYRALRKESDQH